jgi:DNA recombination protein RmuC
MDNLIVILIIILLLANLAILYFQFKKKPKQEENVSEKFKDEINSIKSSFSESFGNMSRDIAKDMTGALTKVDEKVGVFNQHVEALNRGQQNFSRILAGVKQYGVLAEFSLASLLKDLLPASQYIANVKIKPEETSENVEFAVKLQDGVLCPIDSHWPIEKFKAIDDAYQKKNKQMLNDAKKVLASAFRDKAKKIAQKYISQPKTTDFAIVYAPTEGLFSELASYRDPNSKELLTQELIKKYKITIMGPNTLSAFLQALHMGFQTLKVQKHATQIHDDLKMITTRFSRHFDGIKELRKKLEDAIGVTDNFGRDARSIMRTLESIKDPEEVEKAIKEDVDKIKVLNK